MSNIHVWIFQNTTWRWFNENRLCHRHFNDIFGYVIFRFLSHLAKKATNPTKESIIIGVAKWSSVLAHWKPRFKIFFFFGSVPTDPSMAWIIKLNNYSIVWIKESFQIELERSWKKRSNGVRKMAHSTLNWVKWTIFQQRTKWISLVVLKEHIFWVLIDLETA